MYTLIEAAKDKLGGFRQLHEFLVKEGVKATKNGLEVAVLKHHEHMRVSRKMLRVLSEIIGKREYDRILNETERSNRS